MVYLKWFVYYLGYILLLPTVLFVPPVIALFTKAGEYRDDGSYTWGGWWGTFDNPPQGDEGFVSKRALFPEEVEGFKGYINRVQWMWRNKLYGYSKIIGLEWKEDYVISYIGNPDISDKEKIPGWYFAKVKNSNQSLKGFEFYGVFPYSETRDVRIRLGWKVMTDKYERFGFAKHVGTFNPFDGYGDE